MPRRMSVAIIAAFAALMAATAGAERPRVRVLSDFDDAAAPRRAGSHNVLQRSPSTVVLQRVPDGAGQALAVSGKKAPGGLAGVWLAFYDICAARKQFVDASGYDFLTFRIRAGARPPRIMIKVADAATAAKEDAFEVGELTRFLPEDIGSSWRQVAIPLGGLPLDRKALAGLILVVDSPDDFSFVIDDVALKRDPEDALPVAAVDAAFDRHRSFAGIAVHYYDSSRALPEPPGVP